MGTSSPSEKVEVVGGIKCSTSVHVNDGTKIFNTGIEYPRLGGAGSSNRIGFKWSSPNIYGRVDNVVSMVVGTASDRRLKRNIKSITNEDSRKFLNLIQPRFYNSAMFEIDGKEISCECDKIIYGGIAQEVEENFPELVYSPEMMVLKVYTPNQLYL